MPINPRDNLTNVVRCTGGGTDVNNLAPLQPCLAFVSSIDIVVSNQWLFLLVPGNGINKEKCIDNKIYKCLEKHVKKLYNFRDLVVSW